MYLFLLYEVNKNLQTMEKYKTVGVVGLGKKLDISILNDSPFYGTISILKSQESVRVNRSLTVFS